MADNMGDLPSLTDQGEEALPRPQPSAPTGSDGTLNDLPPHI